MIIRNKTVKAFENIMIRRKLASFHSVFPHDGPTAVENIENIYDDILEFSRRGLYSKSVRRAAWKLLLLQIGNGTTAPLVQALARRPLVEEKEFLSTLMTTCMSHVDELNGSLYQEKCTVSSSEEMLLLPPVLGFIAWTATQSDWAFQTVLEGGILDMLLHIYIVFTTLPDTPQDAYLKEALRGACRLILVILGQSISHQRTVFGHPVCILWTGCYGHAVQANLQDRRAAWRRADRSNVMRRVLAIYNCTLWKSTEDAIDVCADIVEFTNAQFFDAEVVDLTFLVMLKQIVFNRANLLISVLANGSHESTVRVFSGLIRLWLQCIGMQINNEVEGRANDPMTLWSSSHESTTALIPKVEAVHKTFCSQEKEAFMMKMMNADRALYHMLRFATETAKQSETVRLGMLDGGSLALVLIAFANVDFRLSGLVAASRKEKMPKGTKSSPRSNVDAEASPPISLAAINAEASTLSFFIHSARFNESWQGQRLGTRLSLCSSLVYSLLGEDKVMDEAYEVARALFMKIVTIDI